MVIFRVRKGNRCSELVSGSRLQKDAGSKDAASNRRQATIIPQRSPRKTHILPSSVVAEGAPSACFLFLSTILFRFQID
jgi:hypothetical protein